MNDLSSLTDDQLDSLMESIIREATGRVELAVGEGIGIVVIVTDGEEVHSVTNNLESHDLLNLLQSCVESVTNPKDRSYLDN